MAVNCPSERLRQDNFYKESSSSVTNVWNADLCLGEWKGRGDEALAGSHRQRLLEVLMSLYGEFCISSNFQACNALMVPSELAWAQSQGSPQ